MFRFRFAAVAIALTFLGSGCNEDPVSPERSAETPFPTDEMVLKTDPSSLEADCAQAIIEGELARSRFGDPLPGLPPSLLARFEAGKEEFEEEDTPEEGLGPVFNDFNCVACHDQGGTGGGGTLVETRFGRRNPDGSFDPLSEYGGSLLQNQGITHGDCKQAAEEVPAMANVIAGRQTTPLFGLGLLDAVPAYVLRWLADPRDWNRDGVSGRLNLVMSPETNRIEIGRFGWKSQVPSVLVFAGDAYLNEMGITSEHFPSESAPQGGPISCDDGMPGLEGEDEDGDGDGVGDGVQGFTDFMRFLAPPPMAGLPNASVLRGSLVFVATQCASCHQPALVTGYVPEVAALSHRRFYPFTDLLLHDMGSLGDGIEQGRASGAEMRTPPLWGLRASPPYLHDGSAATILEAIQAHDGEAARARDRFSRLPPALRVDLLAFLSHI